MNNELYNTTSRLEAYIDGSLSEEQQVITEKMLSENAGLQQEYEYMKHAVSAVQLSGMHARVKNIATAHFAATTNESKVAKIGSIGFYALRVAAVVVVLLISYTALVYATTTPEQIFADSFSNYDLPTSRSASRIATIDQLYKMEKWQAVMDITSAESSSTQKNLFLAGMAAIQLNKIDAATSFFNKVQQLNKISQNKSYQDESEFYLALTYIKLKKIPEAESLLTTIKENPEHAYHSQASKISSFKTKLLSWKY
ncbi:MAG: hypothetical protein QM802_16915 [Agriterribacter sp.]